MQITSYWRCTVCMPMKKRKEHVWLPRWVEKKNERFVEVTDWLVGWLVGWEKSERARKGERKRQRKKCKWQEGEEKWMWNYNTLKKKKTAASLLKSISADALVIDFFVKFCAGGGVGDDGEYSQCSTAQTNDTFADSYRLCWFPSGEEELFLLLCSSRGEFGVLLLLSVCLLVYMTIESYSCCRSEGNIIAQLFFGYQWQERSICSAMYAVQKINH